MQVNLDCKSARPQFGTMHSNEFVNKAIMKRIKTPEASQRLAKAFNRADSNKHVDINLFVNPDDTLSANIYAKNLSKYNYFSQHQENAFTKLFKGPVGFIEGLVVKAEKMAEKVKKQIDIEEIMEKLS